MLNILCPSFDRRRPDGKWQGNTKVTHDSSRVFRTLVAATKLVEEAQEAFDVNCSVVSNNSHYTALHALATTNREPSNWSSKTGALSSQVFPKDGWDGFADNFCSSFRLVTQSMLYFSFKYEG